MEVSPQDCCVLVLSTIRDLLLGAGFWARGVEGSFSLTEPSFSCVSVRTCSCRWYTFLDCTASFQFQQGCYYSCDPGKARRVFVYAFHRFKDPHGNSSLIASTSFMIHEKNEFLLFSFRKCPMECLNFIFFPIFSEVTLISRRWYFTIFYMLEAFYVSSITRVIFQY